MKKLFATLIIVAAVLAGILFYQRAQVAKSLSGLLQGQIYSSYGIKIEIPPSEGSVQGLFKPYVNLPRVILDLSQWGLAQPIFLENAVAFSDLWAQSAVILELPREVALHPKIKIIKPYAELSPPHGILAVGSEAIELLEESVVPQEQDQPSGITKILAPTVLLGPWQQALPSRFDFHWQGIVANTSRGNTLNLGPMGVSFTSQLQGERRFFQFHFKQDPGTLLDSKGSAEIGALEFQFHGDLRELSAAQRRSFKESIRQEWKSWENLRYSLRLRAGPPGSSLTLLSEAFFKSFYSILSKLDLKFEETRLQWEGLKVASTAGKLEFEMSPLRLMQTSEYAEDHFLLDIRASLKKVFVQTKTGSIHLKDTEFKSVSKYLGINYTKFIEFYFNNVDNTMQLFDMTGEVIFSNPKQTLIAILSYLAYYPNQQEFSFKVGQVDYQGADMQAEYQDLEFSYAIEPSGIGYVLSGDFDLKYDEASTANQKGDESIQPAPKKQFPIKSGEASLAMELQFPWQELLNFSRQASSDPQAHPQVMDALVALLEDKEIQYDLDFELDAGKNSFDFEWESEIAAPLDLLLSQIKLGESWKEFGEKNSEEQWMETARQIWLQQGRLKVEIEIERLAKFQKFLDEIQPGASLAMAVLAPYVQIDTKEDILKSELQYKDRQVLVNGSPNESLNKILAPHLSPSQNAQ